jgi:hypothetical protein
MFRISFILFSICTISNVSSSSVPVNDDTTLENLGATALAGVQNATPQKLMAIAKRLRFFIKMVFGVLDIVRLQEQNYLSTIPILMTIVKATDDSAQLNKKVIEEFKCKIAHRS